jgi:drug/metabolite transporter (DMT)-like permease
MTRRQMTILWTLALVWGASFLFIKVGVTTIPPLTFVFFRLAIAALLLFAVMRFQGLKLPRERNLWIGLGFVGFVNAALPYTMFAWGEHQMGANASGLASIYNATTPLWTVVLAQVFVRDERLTPIRTLGVVIGFAGVVFLFASSIGNIGKTDTLGQLVCLIAASCYGVGTLYVRRKFGSVPALISAFGQMFMGAIWLLPIAVIVDHNEWKTPSLASIGALLGLAILGTGVAQILYFALVKQVGATRTSQVTYLLPVFAIFWGWLLLQEPLRADMLIGLGVILLGVVVVNGRLPMLGKRRVEAGEPKVNVRS